MRNSRSNATKRPTSRPWRRWIDTALAAPHDIVSWLEAPAPGLAQPQSRLQRGEIVVAEAPDDLVVFIDQHILRAPGDTIMLADRVKAAVIHIQQHKFNLIAKLLL